MRLKRPGFLNIITTFVLVIGLVVGTTLVKEVANLTGKASGTAANLVVDLGNSFNDAQNSWLYLAQGGEERGRSLSPVISQIKNLGPKYIRIDHVYDFFNVVSRDSNGVLIYNWNELDAYIKDIQAIGAKPFLALSYTPAALGSKDIEMPELGGWTNLVRATIEHVSGRAGLAIADVYYEVWNEPDLFGSFKVYPPKNYLDLYRASSRGASLATNTLPYKFGGPASTALYKNWFDALTKVSADERLRFDFFSWHQYGEDINVLEQNIADTNIWQEKAGNSNLELFITEHGIDSANNSYYDGSMAAIHTLAAAAVSADRLEGLFSFEIKDGPGPAKNWGRWGMLTHEKFGEPTPKPRYSALLFLKQMSAGQRVNIAGVGSWVKAFGRVTPTGARIFVVNYDPEGKHTEAVPIRFVNIPFAQFSFVRRDFNGGTTQIPAVATNKQYQTVQLLKPNSAAIFELVPQK